MKIIDERKEPIDLRVGRNSFSDLAYEYILKAIASHQFEPGDSLRPQDLAVATKLSPTPIKHALARLAGEGLVEFIPGSGPHVAAPSVSEILELFDARAMCEVYAIQEGLHRVDSGFLAKLDNLRSQYEAASTEVDRTREVFLRQLEADKDFHYHLVSLWPNRKVQTWYGQLNIHLKAYRLSHVPEYVRSSAVEEHRAICEAVEKRDVNQAVEAVRRHISAAKASFAHQAQVAGTV